MNIMSKNPDFMGQYRLIEDWAGYIPSGFIEADISVEDFQSYNGFVIPTIENGKVVAIIENKESQSAWKATQPNQIRADIDFIAAMQGVSL